MVTILLWIICLLLGWVLIRELIEKARREMDKTINHAEQSAKSVIREAGNRLETALLKPEVQKGVEVAIGVSALALALYKAYSENKKSHNDPV